VILNLVHINQRIHKYDMVRVLKPMGLCVILALHVDKRAVVILNLATPSYLNESTNLDVLSLVSQVPGSSPTDIQM